MVCFGNNSLLLEAEFCLRCSLTSSLDLINGLSITRSFFSLASSRTFPHFCLLRSYIFICFCSPAFRTWDQKGQFNLNTDHIEYKRPVRTALLSIPGWWAGSPVTVSLIGGNLPNQQALKTHCTWTAAPAVFSAGANFQQRQKLKTDKICRWEGLSYRRHELLVEKSPLQMQMSVHTLVIHLGRENAGPFE